MSAQGLSSRAILGRMFMKLEQGALGWIDRLSMHIDSNQESETHKWLGMSAPMRERIAGRIIKGLRENGITIVNLPYESSLAVLTEELRRDKTGQILARIDDMARRANSHGASLLTTLIEGGASGVCYDGQYFFDTDHSEGASGTQSNDITVDISALPVQDHGSTTQPSADEMASVVMEILEDLYGFKDDQGEPINEGATEFLVMTPPTLWGRTVAGVSAEKLSGGTVNPLQKLKDSQGLSVDVVMNPRLTWTDKIVVFRADSSDGVKPFINQEEVPLRASAQAEGSPEEFNNYRHVYGLDWDGGMGYGFWQHAELCQLI